MLPNFRPQSMKHMNFLYGKGGRLDLLAACGAGMLMLLLGRNVAPAAQQSRPEAGADGLNLSQGFGSDSRLKTAVLH